jgi:hypothetical protein
LKEQYANRGHRDRTRWPPKPSLEGRTLLAESLADQTK